MKTTCILFDLDNTLANTDSLEEIRLSHDLYNLKANLSGISLYPKTKILLDSLIEKNVPIGLVTNSPRWYVDILLEHFELTNYFPVVITYTEAIKFGGAKPSGLGIIKALELLNIEASPQVLYIGDDYKDILASYEAKVTPIVPTWASRKPVSQMPSAVLSTEVLLNFIDDLDNTKLIAELCADKETFDFPKKLLNFVPLDKNANVITLSQNLRTLCFGRYFTKQSPISATYQKDHKLSLEILRKETEENYKIPQYFCDLLVHTIRKIPEYIHSGIIKFDIITVIPAKFERTPRLENLLSQIEENLKNDNVLFLKDLFYFDKDAESSKNLGPDERIIENNTKFHMNKSYVNILENKNILIIDDVITTGSTLRRANELLEAFNPNRILNICFAKTVSMSERKVCPTCQSLMVIRTNGSTQIDFWGCKNRNCSYTEDIKIKDCPECDEPMVIKLNKRGQYFLSCKGYHNEPPCRHAESYNG
ncbi:phosphoglycolate phosphatase [Acinetobacter calcoaceticus]|uniref:HAD-IA family hydrolase n=1 Tax=Acinetobacter calcoaceticus TaxID=471 RepID=UPI0002E5F6F8|nr:HAD-IA family hydrolase [Acinetobacter calcoaceticus]